ncbi:hypothetical protein GCM10027343_37280 [Noviherbaspirillum agri]
MWADTVDEMNETVDALDKSNALLKQWRAYAQKLELALNEANSTIRRKSGEAEGHAELKQMALKELEQFDPSNKLLDSEYCKTIYTKIKEETIRKLEQK